MAAAFDLDLRPLPRAVLVAIIGAGPAGLGMARVLSDLGVPDVHIFERHSIGSSFKRWPKEMQFISPSFTGNAFGLTDLNAISYDSSPAFALKREHPTGSEYAAYLEQASELFGLDVTTGIDVQGLEPDEEEIILFTNEGEIRARFVIWAGGQFQYPSLEGVAGAEHGIHSGAIPRWTEYPGDNVTVIGGYESGIDAAIGLSNAGKTVTVLSRAAPWTSNDSDPSVALSPYTRQRLNNALRDKRISLVADVDVLGLARSQETTFILSADGRSWTSKTKPILALGYRGSTSLLGDWFERGDDDHPVLTLQDESTVLPGLFLVGPEVHHRGHLFCFIYKFRQRFAVVARAIAGRLGLETDALQAYRANNMYLDDLSCCDIENCRC